MVLFVASYCSDISEGKEMSRACHEATVESMSIPNLVICKTFATLDLGENSRMAYIAKPELRITIYPRRLENEKRVTYFIHAGNTC